ncbi:biotin transporter BioY [Rhizobium sp. SSA_523]|uniref:biotin transporter BioY n=1 Tax=Rhizobium sp. SSA_523 TaxID=2952477 RepID=UPI0020918167|nr:biotin transporter BioY [Rhizobium sp. SSA_523]MCO5730484.1 biotin transporter BioY [Rhizobium sp. SSA_523]WKC25523.1 biotin transporter BioY [Rhizobium sp. SSA_523]
MDLDTGLTAGRASKWVRRGMIILGGAAVMTAAAKIQIPFWPVPMTLHTMAVMAFAVLLGPRFAGAIFLLYLSAGATGLPVFSGSPERGIGLAYMAGPTGGYLLGFLLASVLVGHLAGGPASRPIRHPTRRPEARLAGSRAGGKAMIRQMGAMLVGLGVIYAAGLAWLALFVPADRLLALGVAPFLLGDLVKCAAVAVGSAIFGSGLSRLLGPGR